MAVSTTLYNNMFIYVLIIVNWFMIVAFADPKTMSIVLDKDSTKISDYIQIINPPHTLHRKAITIEYTCTGSKLIGIEVQSEVDGVQSQKVFQKIWKCPSPSLVETVSALKKKVRIKLPPAIAYNYNRFNKEISFTSNTKLRAWILDRDWWPSCFQQKNCFTRSRVKVAYDAIIPSPFSRPYLRVSKQCRLWSWDVLTTMTSRVIPTCPVEAEVVHVIEYPVVLGGKPYGVYRQFHPYTHPALEAQRLQQLHKPRFTVAIWLYLLEYCPGQLFDGKLCSVMYHFNWNSNYHTLLIFMTPEGKFHMQIEHADGQTSAGMSLVPAPLHQWIRLVLSFQVNTWHLTINHGTEYNETISTSYTHPANAFMDDTQGLFTFGGADHRDSVRGYIGHATIYRNKVVQPEQIPYPSKFHPMFELKLTSREERCKHYIDWVNRRIDVHRTKLFKRQQRNKCRNPLLDMVARIRSPPIPGQCEAGTDRHRKYWSFVNRIVGRMVRNRVQISFQAIADELYGNATALLDEQLDLMPRAFPLLKQAACFGNNDAMFMVAVILNNGIYVKADEIQSQAYLMMAALENHRLSALALGHKHRYGLDGVPVDPEQAYRYYKYVADTTRQDKEKYKTTDVYTESIRLTDEVALHEQTDEDGDIFHWLTHQAKQGVLSAQNKVGRALFWGSNGLKRNVDAALEYFRMSAETGDSQSQYDYGIVLMRGDGVKKDMDKGLGILQKSAEQSNPSALNALGWHAMNVERNMTKAVELYERAYRMNNPDAAYNLGVLYLHGSYPDREKDVDKALAYFIKAGSRGQMDAGVLIAYQMMKGTGKQPRQVSVAVEWARFIAEKNPAIGFVLRKGIHAYRKGKRDVSLFYYMLAADAGLEVGAFNLAWLCEENMDGISSFIEKECVWRQYNMSIQREFQFVDAYSLIKMGDYYWYGCHGHKDVKRAAEHYSQAALKHDPHALFNLGFMLEEGAHISPRVLDTIGVPHSRRADNVTLLEYIYTRCKESRKSEAFLPCSIALWRLQALSFWVKYQTVIKLLSFSGALALLMLSSYIFVHTHLRRSPVVTDSI